jgi:hypothetical protein
MGCSAIALRPILKTIQLHQAFANVCQPALSARLPHSAIFSARTEAPQDAWLAQHKVGAAQ